jgi:hypothetical protein
MVRLVMRVRDLAPQHFGIGTCFSQITCIFVSFKQVLIIRYLREVADRVPDCWAVIVAVPVVGMGEYRILRGHGSPEVTENENPSPPLWDAKFSGVEHLNWFHYAIARAFELTYEFVQNAL